MSATVTPITRRSENAVPAATVCNRGWVRWARYATNGHRTYRHQSGAGWVLICPMFARITGRGPLVVLHVAGVGPDGSEQQRTITAVHRGHILAAALHGTGIDVRAVADVMTRTDTPLTEVRIAWRGLSRAMDARELDARGGRAA